MGSLVDGVANLVSILSQIGLANLQLVLCHVVVRVRLARLEVHELLRHLTDLTIIREAF